jgi:hypothetical protein
MKKVFLVSLIMVLLGALVVPAIAAPAPAAALNYTSTMTCSPTSLNFRVYLGVPTYLLGFIPLDDGQTLTLTHTNGAWWDTIAGWSATDDADWLNEVNADFQIANWGTISGNNQGSMIVRVDTDKLSAAGTYTATITITISTCGTTKIEVPVTVNVITPKVEGPICIGADKELLKNVLGDEIFEAENAYSGEILNLLTNPQNISDMQAISTAGPWNMSLLLGPESDQVWPILGGNVTLNGTGYDIKANSGTVGSFAGLMDLMTGVLTVPDGFDWGNNYVMLFTLKTGGRTGTLYMGIVLGEVGKLLDLLPSLTGLFATEEPEATDLGGAPSANNVVNGAGNAEPSTELTIPLKPILEMLPTLMPVLSPLLENQTLLSLLAPLMNALPPIMVLMPFKVITDLSGLLG